MFKTTEEVIISKIEDLNNSYLDGGGDYDVAEEITFCIRTLCEILESIYIKNLISVVLRLKSLEKYDVKSIAGGPSSAYSQIEETIQSLEQRNTFESTGSVEETGWKDIKPAFGPIQEEDLCSLKPLEITNYDKDHFLRNLVEELDSLSDTNTKFELCEGGVCTRSNTLVVRTRKGDLVVESRVYDYGDDGIESHLSINDIET